VKPLTPYEWDLIGSRWDRVLWWLMLALVMGLIGFGVSVIGGCVGEKSKVQAPTLRGVAIAKTRSSQSLVTSAATRPALYLMWDNPETWCVNLVEFKTDLRSAWRTYSLVTNSNVFACALRLEATNDWAVYRVACVYFP
jgi:hypothetical protein